MIEKKKKGKRSKKPTETELSMLYSQMTAKEVGEHYGVAESTVRKWILDYRKEKEYEESNS